MLFLNRRGYAGFVSCRSCGHVMECPHCDVSMTYHREGMLKCHYCGYELPMPKICPECGSPYIGTFGLGTQKVESAIYKEFPQARVLRMDMDTTRKKHSYEEILKAFSKGEADILVGTQMIVKGHDYANVTLVGILAADLSLHANDYRAGERTFQLLTQAAGRAGRGDKGGEVVIQTYSPEHYSIVAAAKQDYKEFYQQEIGYRSLMKYPPVWQMLVIFFSGRQEEETVRLSFYGIEVDKKTREVSCDGRRVELTLKEYELLVYLMEHQSRVVTRDELLNQIWGYSYDGETRTLDMHIRTLRQKLGEDGGSCIKTVRGVGYRLVR